MSVDVISPISVLLRLICFLFLWQYHSGFNYWFFVIFQYLSQQVPHRYFLKLFSYQGSSRLYAHRFVITNVKSPEQGGGESFEARDRLDSGEALGGPHTQGCGRSHGGAEREASALSSR